MRIFNGIIGVLAIFGAYRCIFLSGLYFLNYGWIVAFVLFLWGLSAIFTYFTERKETQKGNSNTAATGAIGLVLGIAACVLSVIAVSRPVLEAFVLLLIFVVFLIFLFVSGVRELIHATKIRKSDNPKGWGVSLTVGIVLLLIGIGGIVSWMCLDALSGVTMGVMLGIFGIAMLISVFEAEDDIFDSIDEI